MFKSILLVLVSMFVLINCGSPTSPDDIDISVSEDMYGVWVNADAPTFMKVCFGRDSSYTLYRNDYAVTRNGTYSPHTKDSLLLEYEVCSRIQHGNMICCMLDMKLCLLIHYISVITCT